MQTVWEALLVKYLPYSVMYSNYNSDSLNRLNLKSLLYYCDEKGWPDFSTLKNPYKPGSWMDILVSKANGDTFLYSFL